MAAVYREGRKTSVAWDHFEIKDKERGLATCNFCQETFSYRTSVSNLMKHLRSKHAIIKFEDDSMEADATSENPENVTVIEKTDADKAKLWDYFELKDTKQAECKLCQLMLSYETVNNLITHIEGHDVNLEEIEEIEVYDPNSLDAILCNLEDKVQAKNGGSVAWQYFDIQNADQKIACCRLCDALCSYRSSVSNLVKHVRRKHGADGPPAPPQEESTQAELRNILWLYFKPGLYKKARCLICRKMLSYSSTLTNLKKHLNRKHPNAEIPDRNDGMKRVLVSENGKLYELETTAEIVAASDDDADADALGPEDSTTEYLEEFDAAEEIPVKKSKRKPEPLMPVDDTSSEEEITFINRYVKKHNDMYDHFGKYIASALREMPKEVSNRLQIDFVNQIMNVQSSLGTDSNDKVCSGTMSST